MALFPTLPPSQSLPLPPPPALRELNAHQPVALFLDFDGTLVEIAPTPDAIAVPDGLAADLVRLAARLEGRLAIVSGRDLTDLARYLGAVPLARAGSHGAAMQQADGTWLEAPPLSPDPAVIAEVEAFARTTGARFERKDHGAALHSRNAPHLEAPARAFIEALAARHALAVKPGKFVAELTRPGADKGSAVRAFMAADPFTGARPLFLGDDITDEDGFAAAREQGGLAIAVGPRPTSLAHFALADAQAVRDWLAA